MLFFRPWSLIFTCLTTSLSWHRGVSVFNSAGAASLQAADLEPQETQGEGRSKKAGNRVVFTRMCKDGGRTGSIQLGQVSFWRRGGGMEKEGLQRQWRRITHWMGNTQRRNGKGRQGKARESKARQGKARQGDPLAFLDAMPMCKSHMWNYSDEKRNLRAVCVIALITEYVASVVNAWLLWRCEVVQVSSCFLGTWLSVVGLCGHLMLQSVGPTGEQSPSQYKGLLAGEEICEEACQLLYRDRTLVEITGICSEFSMAAPPLCGDSNWVVMA
ncbi:hypothetical protein QYF61_022470 [Mycteria americana]|uniref:Uncharacterized protein n=1 Tax=Mycteria americana TaxID=33587 RepID=A0AAN7RIX3_MYCAM|nr:hypothetical protein QYF61_022470 [Mycteria americana]